MEIQFRVHFRFFDFKAPLLVVCMLIQILSVTSNINSLKVTLTSDANSSEITEIPFDFHCNIAELQNGRAKMIYPMVGWIDICDPDIIKNIKMVNECDIGDEVYSITEIGNRALQISKYEVRQKIFLIANKMGLMCLFFRENREGE